MPVLKVDHSRLKSVHRSYLAHDLSLLPDEIIDKMVLSLKEYLEDLLQVQQ